jgi:hypothetical protein
VNRNYLIRFSCNYKAICNIRGRLKKEISCGTGGLWVRYWPKVRRVGGSKPRGFL